MKTLSDSSMLNLNHAAKLRMSPIAGNRHEQNTNPDIIKNYMLSQGGGYGGDHGEEMVLERNDGGIADPVDTVDNNNF